MIVQVQIVRKDEPRCITEFDNLRDALLFVKKVNILKPDIIEVQMNFYYNLVR